MRPTGFNGRQLLAVCLAAMLLQALGMTTAAAQSSAPTRSSSQLSELFYQLQVMQQEVQDLRGLVEEQSHQIRRLQKDQKAQYIDLDGRMAALSNGSVGNAQGAAPAGPSGNQSGGGSNPTASQSGGTSGANPAAGATSGEQADYNAAYALLRERKFDESLRAFNRLLSDYPGGAYTGNTMYWLGELYLVQGEAERARGQFVQVIDLFGEHPKVPDALYKLGVTYHRLGDKHQALEYLNRVRGQYPQHSAAKLAAEYAREMQ